MRRTTLLLLGPIFAALGSTATPTPAAEGEVNPAAEGFDLAGSDPEAVEVADRVMERMGGRAAWDRTRHFRWRFFGRRLHVWDKQTGDIRVEGVGRDDGEPYVILMNLGSKKGRAWRSGREIEEPAELAEMLDFGEAAWINDSYWMFMPYKLKDSGVTLEYLGERKMEDGRAADVLQLTFSEVGRTPENKYHVYVARDTGLVEQWDFFRNVGEEEPEFKNPWHNWKSYGSILLSDNRGDGGHTELATFGKLPESVFRDPAPVDWSSLE